MSNIIDKALEVISNITSTGEGDWITKTTGERFGVRYTDDAHTDALLDEGWTHKAQAQARRKELRAAGAVDVRVVKITTRWRRHPRKAAAKKKGDEAKPEETKAESKDTSAEE